MSTRHAKDDSVLHQCGFASSADRGLIANIIAKRCAVLTSPADREIVWFVQYLSHQAGGLAAVSEDLQKKFSHRLGTSTMAKLASRKAQTFSADEVREIRLELPSSLRRRFPLHGETTNDVRDLSGQYGRLARQAERYRELQQMSENLVFQSSETLDSLEELNTVRRAEREKVERREAGRHPASYPVSVFYDLCTRAAIEGMESTEAKNLERELAVLCLEHSNDLQTIVPWYFTELVNVLREYKTQWTAIQSQGAITAVVRKVHETLEYTADAGILCLLTGDATVGQSFAAEQWCAAHPDRARICDVPASNDEASFYREIANKVGLGNFLNYKNVQIRERVEFFLQTSGICLVLNHAENLWPQKNLREAFPGRLAWLFAQVARGASACMISGPQFFMQQRTCEKTGWNSPEFRKKIDHMDRLPDCLSVEDMTAIARVMLPEVSEKVQSAVAIYAVGQQRDLSALKNISNHAQKSAKRAGRIQRTSQDVIDALKFVSGSDKLLREAFRPALKHPGRPPSQAIPAGLIEPGEPVTHAVRTVAPAPPSFAQRQNSVEPVQA